jgi:hypothetical protein
MDPPVPIEVSSSRPWISTAARKWPPRRPRDQGRTTEMQSLPGFRGCRVAASV